MTTVTNDSVVLMLSQLLCHSAFRSYCRLLARASRDRDKNSGGASSDSLGSLYRNRIVSSSFKTH